MDGPNQGPDPGVLYFGGKERKESEMSVGVGLVEWVDDVCN